MACLIGENIVSSNGFGRNEDGAAIKREEFWEQLTNAVENIGGGITKNRRVGKRLTNRRSHLNIWRGKQEQQWTKANRALYKKFRSNEHFFKNMYTQIYKRSDKQRRTVNYRIWHNPQGKQHRNLWPQIDSDHYLIL